MSLIRPNWVDGQSITTPDLQRGFDTASYADDRVYEVLLTPGLTQKKICPLTEESAAGTLNPFLLVVPSVTNGKVSCMPCHFVAGTSGNAQAVTYSANLLAKLDAPAIGSNSSGSNRYDLIYATVNRTVPNTIASPPANTAYAGTGLSDSSTATTTRKVKSVVDGSISTQTVNLYDSPTITLSVNAGFLTGATAPTAGQIAAATPSDTTTSFNFALAYLTVANGYTAGNAIAQSTITPTWNAARIRPQRNLVLRPGSITTGVANEKISAPSTERFGSIQRFFIPFKLLTTTNTGATPVVLDNLIDWTNRYIKGTLYYMGSALNVTLTAGTTVVNPLASTTITSIQGNFTNSINPIGAGTFTFTSAQLAIAVSSNLSSVGSLVMWKVANPNDTVNGDFFLLDIEVSDKLVA